MAKSGDQYVLREFRSNDYAEFAGWWRPDNPPPVTSLPRIGLVCGDMKAVGFLANTDTDFAIITWWFANPLNKPKESYGALVQLFKGLVDAAICVGKRMVFVYTGKRAIIRMLETLGFRNYDGHLIKRLS